MKFIIFLLLIIFAINVNAEIQIFKEQYYIGETFQAELNFQNLVEDIKISDIIILDSNKAPANIGVIFTKVNNEKYFIYFDVPEIEESTYTLKINNIKYMENEILKKENFEKSFAVLKKDTDIISIKPPLIMFKIGEKSFFKIDIINKGQNVVNVNIINENNITDIFNNNLTLSQNSISSFYFDINKNKIENQDKINIKINYNDNFYILPVYIISQETKEAIRFFAQKEAEKIYLSLYNVDIPFGSYAEGSLFLENNLDENITNLKLILTNNLDNVLKLGFIKIDNFESKKTLQLSLFFNRNSPLGSYSGNLIIKNDKFEYSLPISINLLENKVYDEIEKKEEIFEEIIEKPVEKTEVKIEEDFKEVPVKTKKPVSKKTLSYILISIIILIFIIFYFIIFLKSGKNKPKKMSDLFK